GCSLGYCVTVVNYRIVSILLCEFGLLSATQSMLLSTAVLQSERGLRRIDSRCAIGQHAPA
ncbi:MAG: hypothetical protein OSA77_08170, partial [Halioglobus sp.]|nr:hypothetical protein [Halioglobus sp.]